MSNLRLAILISIAVSVVLPIFGIISWLAALMLASGIPMVLFGIVAMSTILDKDEHEYKFAVGLMSFGFGAWLLYLALVTL